MTPAQPGETRPAQGFPAGWYFVEFATLAHETHVLFERNVLRGWIVKHKHFYRAMLLPAHMPAPSGREVTPSTVVNLLNDGLILGAYGTVIAAEAGLAEHHAPQSVPRGT